MSAARGSDEDARGRERALNALLLASLFLALIPGVQRVVQISQGGPETADHVHTLVVVGLAVVGFALLLGVSRSGRPVGAAWSLLGVYYLVGAWSTIAEGPGKSTTILVWALFLVAAATLCGSRPAWLAAVLVGATLAIVAVLDSLNVLTIPKESSPAVPDAVGGVEIVGVLGAMGLLLAVRARERSGSAPISVGPSAAVPAGARQSRIDALSPREREVVRLVALGLPDAAISRELVVSPRTVNSHVSSALRKTACANRTELAMLAAQHGLVEPSVEPEFGRSARPEGGSQ